MRITITGVCGFVGSSLARFLPERVEGLEITGIDNLSRPGSESNRAPLASLGVKVIHGDIRQRSDLDSLPPADWVIDAAANPSVLAGVDGKTSLRQLMEHNLGGTLNLAEYCAQHGAGLILLSTSRVYSIPPLSALPVREHGGAFTPDDASGLPTGVSCTGVTENFSVRAPISPYGATKLASETVALEYGAACGFPVWVNRCGVLAGAGQFGTPEQGIFSYWLHAHAARRQLRYIGFGGAGLQTRDAMHPSDLADLIVTQFGRTCPADPVFNAGGGAANSMSLKQLTAWCDDRFGKWAPEPDLRPRPFDIPWLVMDSGRAAAELNWRPARTLSSILDEIGEHVRKNPGWLEMSGAK